MIRSDTIDLDDFSDETTPLPSQSSTAIRELLVHGDRYMQIKGLELATNLGNPSQFLPEVKTLLSDADDRLRHGIVKLYSERLDGETLKQFVNLLTHDNPILRATALEILIVNKYTLNK